MVLPRYWPYQVQANLDIVRNIGKEAAAYAEQNKATELEYYDIMCAPTLGSNPVANAMRQAIAMASAYRDASERCSYK